MTIDELENLITEYNLSIRRIPLTETSIYEMRHHKEGNEIIVDKKGRSWTKETTTPKNAGKFVVKCHSDTFNSNVVMEDTLIDAVTSYIKSVKE